MRVIGTAGHVDHGKSTLVQALTGTHPDRLREEQQREMTIDLGFAWLTLDDGQDVGIVDVPGHRDFIENMLAGVGGIDAVIFVVAADESVMPQTLEHLAILNILRIPAGVIVMTKIDMVDDPDWLDLVELDIRRVVQGTVLENAEIVRVSARTGDGIVKLKHELQTCLAEQPERPDLDRPRLPIDRIFTITGFGTVVTGTLLDGHFDIGDEIEILPGVVRGRIRGLQSHKRKVQTANPGSRTAVNFTGIEVNEVKRGNWCVHPRTYSTTQRMDVRIELLMHIQSPLKHNTDVKCFLGTAEVQARVRLLGVEELQPGEAGWLQLELAEPVVALRGDRYIIRRPSPGETLGGGNVVDPLPKRRHKRFAQDILDRLVAFQQGSPAEILMQASLTAGVSPVRDIVQRSRLADAEAIQGMEELISSGQWKTLESGDITPTSEKLVAAMPAWLLLVERVKREMQAYHRNYPLRRGMPREELKSRLKHTPKAFNIILSNLAVEGHLVEENNTLFLPDHSIRFNTIQENAVKKLMAEFDQKPDSPPSVKECMAITGEDVYQALIELDQLVPVSVDVVYRKSDYDRIRQYIIDHLTTHDTITVAEFRDRFSTSRKYALALMEHLDGLGITQRVGDFRRLRKRG